MNRHSSKVESLTHPAPTDLSDSLDVRLIAAGRLSPTAVSVRHDRAELAAVLARWQEPPDITESLPERSAI
jgi:hypothetical protein